MESVIIILVLAAVFFSVVWLSKYENSILFLYAIIPNSKKRRQEQLLTKYFHYYSQLSAFEQKRFIIRVNRFINRTDFIGRKGFQVSGAVELMIAASAIQLTFGFYNYKFSIFRTILIYPDKYKNSFTGNYHKGELNPRGIIVFSWKHFLKGYKDSSDNINLGLHEMAHALLHTLLKSNDLDYGLDQYLKNFVKLSAREIRKIRKREVHFFRSYAGENLQEFFAVAVEHFFESPQQFRAELPNLYKHLSFLLNQDPVNKQFFLFEKPTIFGSKVIFFKT